MTIQELAVEVQSEVSTTVPVPEQSAGGGECVLLRGQGLPLGPIARRYPLSERSVVRVLRDQALRRPDKPWLVFDGRDALTFGDAWTATCQVAAALESEVGRGAHVALLLRNEPAFMPALHGTLLSGGTAIPLNAEAQGVLLGRVVVHCDARVVLARRDLLHRLAELPHLGRVELVVAVGDAPDGEALPARLGDHDVRVVGWADWLAREVDATAEHLPAYSDTAVLQYTSGTTGGPKGAMHPHHFVYLYSAIYADGWGVTSDDVLTTPLPLYHVAALAAIAHVALHVGCTAHLKSRFSPRAFWHDAAHDGATAAFLLGPMVALIMKTTPTAPPHRMASVVTVPAYQPERFRQLYGARMLWQAYGMTEVCPMPARDELLPGVPEDTLGHPVSWVDYGVVDEDDQLLPPGQVGEMVYRSRLPYGMATGYYKEAELTQRAFRNFAFHTGDLAALDADGMLHFRGRSGDRVRRRGEMVSVGELESVVLRHEAVLEAAAYGVPSELGEEDIKLDVVLTSEISCAELHGWLCGQTAPFMVPRYIEVCSSFPKTPSERTQKFKLRERGLNRAEVFDAGDGARSAGDGARSAAVAARP